VRIRDWEGCQSQDLTSDWCSVKVISNLEVTKSNTLAVASSEQEQNFIELEEKEMSHTQLLWASMIFFCFILTDEYTIFPSKSPETTNFSQFERAIA
jgi:hypothetical protein